MALLSQDLLPASYRGAPFAVLADETGGGRRVALHQYPGRDDPWAEDMGRAARTFRFRGFIVDGDVLFAGGPIQLQRALLLAALEKSGPGVMTHPTLGVLNVSVTRFSLGQDLGAGRMSSVEIEFVEAGKKQFPSLLSARSGLLTAANLAKVALAVDAVRAIALAASLGGRRRDLSTTAATMSSQMVLLGGDATALYRLAAQLPGNNGRYAGGGNAGLSGRATATATLDDLTVAASDARSAIGAAAMALQAAVIAADLGYASDLVNAATKLVDALADACSDPADVVRLLEQLLGYQSPRPEALTAIGQAFARAIHRAAAARLVTAAGDYQPTSADDAAAMIARLAGLLDTIATEAADAHDDESFRAIRAARAAVVQDLRQRGATLARVRQYQPGAAVPSLALAQRYYRDATRAAQLVTQAQPVHPLFMPATFQALAA